MESIRCVVQRGCIVGVALLLFCLSAGANTSVRNWTLQETGKTFSAELVDYNEKTGRVHLRVNEVEDRDFAFQSLSHSDQAWLVQWKEMDDEMLKTLQKLGGSYVFHPVEAARTGFWVYRPSNSPETEPLPLFILFSPNGDAGRFFARFAEMAEAIRCTLVCSPAFHNTKNDEGDPEMLKQFQVLLPVIEGTVAHDPARMFLAGTSGGACRAFHYSALIPRPWAGVFSNCGWLGGPDYYHLPFPANLRVAIVNGHQDIPAKNWVERDSKVLAKRGETIAVFSFEGGHQIPPPSVQIKAAEWLLRRRE